VLCQNSELTFVNVPLNVLHAPVPLKLRVLEIVRVGVIEVEISETLNTGDKSLL
jgi:hypothetical protein